MLGRRWIDDLEMRSKTNTNFREVLFTGNYLQLTTMCLAPHEEIGGEVHSEHDQFLRIEKGHARIQLGKSQDEVNDQHDVGEGCAVIVPAGVWHNVVNIGEFDLKLSSLYAPPAHAVETVHPTRSEAQAGISRQLNLR